MLAQRPRSADASASSCLGARMRRRPACSRARRRLHLPRSSSAALGAAQQQVGQWITVYSSDFHRFVPERGPVLSHIVYRQEGPLTVIYGRGPRICFNVGTIQWHSQGRQQRTAAGIGPQTRARRCGLVASIAYCQSTIVPSHRPMRNKRGRSCDQIRRNK